MTAIEDMLFGIPERSPYNFLHSYDVMRVGAVHGERRRLLRVSAAQNPAGSMILGPNGDPLPGDERLLAPFLGGADRVYFDRMFNLSHGRLAQGGRAIIEVKDDVGQMLFAAGTGLADLQGRLKQLEEQADRLWAPTISPLGGSITRRPESIGRCAVKATRALSDRQCLADGAQRR